MEKIKKNKLKVFKIIIFVITILILIGLTIYLFPIMNKLLEPNGKKLLKRK